MSFEQQQKPKRRPGLYDLAEMRVVAPAFTVEQVNRWLAEQRFMEQPQATATTKTSIDATSNAPTPLTLQRKHSLDSLLQPRLQIASNNGRMPSMEATIPGKRVAPVEHGNLEANKSNRMTHTVASLTGNESSGATASFGQPAFGPTAAAAATCDLHEHGAPQTNMNDFRSNDSTNNDLQQLLHEEATSRSQKQKIRELEAILGDFGFCSFDPSLFVQADEKVDADVGYIIDKIGEVALQELQTKCLNELLSYYYRCLNNDYKIPTSIRLNLSTALFIKTRRSLVLGLKSIQESPVPKPTYSQKVIAYLQWTMLCPTKQSGHSMTQFLEARIDVQEEAFKRMDAPLVKHARDLLMIKSCKSCDKAGRLDLACKTCKGERTTVGQKRLNDTFSALKQLHHALVNDDLKGGDGNPWNYCLATQIQSRKRISSAFSNVNSALKTRLLARFDHMEHKIPSVDGPSEWCQALYESFYDENVFHVSFDKTVYVSASRNQVLSTRLVSPAAEMELMFTVLTGTAIGGTVTNRTDATEGVEIVDDNGEKESYGACSLPVISYGKFIDQWGKERLCWLTPLGQPLDDWFKTLEEMDELARAETVCCMCTSLCTDLWKMQTFYGIVQRDLKPANIIVLPRVQGTGKKEVQLTSTKPYAVDVKFAGDTPSYKSAANAFLFKVIDYGSADWILSLRPHTVTSPEVNNPMQLFGCRTFANGTGHDLFQLRWIIAQAANHGENPVATVLCPHDIRLFLYSKIDFGSMGLQGTDNYLLRERVVASLYRWCVFTSTGNRWAIDIIEKECPHIGNIGKELEKSSNFVRDVAAYSLKTGTKTERIRKNKVFLSEAAAILVLSMLLHPNPNLALLPEDVIRFFRPFSELRKSGR
ncbi:hypothetical protein MPSEU_000543900 [Mayamaea pseudoterrestris]|nr:hypothetical protein MPSEU_000543900 [Mayamaea pseudoterrestris]